MTPCANTELRHLLKPRLAWILLNQTGGRKTKSVWSGFGGTDDGWNNQVLAEGAVDTNPQALATTRVRLRNAMPHAARNRSRRKGAGGARRKRNFLWMSGVIEKSNGMGVREKSSQKLRGPTRDLGQQSTRRSSISSAPPSPSQNVAGAQGLDLSGRNWEVPRICLARQRQEALGRRENRERIGLY